MPTLPTQSFNTIVQNIVAGVQGRASKLVNFAIGATLRAVAEAFAGVFLWFQALALQLLLATRLSTSTGNDVDTFVADFMPVVPGTSSPRLGAQSASGQVTFARFTGAPAQCFVPVGATVRTADGSQAFAVTEDATYSTFVPANPSTGTPAGYVMAAGLTTLVTPVKALVAGSGGNVAEGAISVITSTLQGVDTVSNAAAFANGVDQESDDGLKKRFADYIAGLSRGDYFGTAAAIEGTAVIVQWSLTEDYNLDGSWHPGYYFIVADDGSGSPSSDFLAAITKAANAVRPLATWCSVFAPTILYADVAMQVATAPSYDHATVVGLVHAAITQNINALGLGNPLPFSRLAAWAYSVPGVTGVTAVTLNASSGDDASLSATRQTNDGHQTIAYATIKARTISVS